MDFKATILFDASPSLLKVANRVIDVLSATIVLNHRPAPDFTESKGVEDVSKEVKEVKLVTDASQTKKPEATVDAVAQTTSSQEPDAVPAVKYTKEQVKAAAAAKKDKRDEMKKILDEMGAKSIPALSEDQYEEFMQKISLL